MSPGVIVVTCCCYCYWRRQSQRTEAWPGSWAQGLTGALVLGCPEAVPAVLSVMAFPISPQAAGAVLRGAHQLALGGAVQVPGLQQGCVRPLRVLLTAPPVPQKLQRDAEQGPQQAFLPPLGPHR